MNLTDTKQAYGAVSIANHWATAVLVVAAIGLGWIFEDLESGALKGNVAMVHTSIGMLILILALLRLGWHATQPRPEPAAGSPDWERRAARIGHGALLAMLVIMPVAGILMQLGEGRPVGLFGLVLVEGSGREIEALEKVGHVVHGLGANLLIALIVVHILAALKHHVLDRDPTLTRMLGRQPRAVALETGD